MTLCCATLRAAVVQVAVPVAVSTGRAVQPAMSLPPSLNATVPAGCPAPGLLTEMAAVKVTDWPYTEGLGDELSAVLVLALSIVSVPAT